MKHLEQEEIVRLIVHYLSDNASDDEINYLKNWIEASSSNKTYYNQIKNIWEITMEIPGKSSISIENALKKVMSKLPVKRQKHSIFFYWQRVAAILIIPILVGGYIWIRMLSAGASLGVTYNEVYATFGTRSAVKLADGSKVWLNSGSSLRYPDRFIGKQRVVYLMGEAYFEVKSDKSSPFIVQTPTASVKATGTKFNVSAYKSNKDVAVTLIEGKVSVSAKKDRNKTRVITEMKPKQYLEFDTLSNDTKLKENEDVYKHIAWKDGKLVFRNEPMSEVVKKISQFYNVEIELQGETLQEYRYRATFKDESLDEILKLLKISSPINYKEISRKPLPDGSFPKKKVVIFPI